jgi:hypothetical protein
VSWRSLRRVFFVAFVLLPATLLTIYEVTGDDTYFKAILIILVPYSMVGYVYGFIFLGLLSIVVPVNDAVGLVVMGGIFTAIAHAYARMPRLALDACRARRRRRAAV